MSVCVAKPLASSALVTVLQQIPTQYDLGSVQMRESRESES